MSLQRMLTLSILASIATVSSGCGGGNTSSSSSNGASTGQFSLAITDAPIDSAAHVVVEFTGVSIQPAGGEVIEFTFDEPRSLDLLALQGNLSEPLVSGAAVPAGEYEWIRLHVNAESDGLVDSYIEMNDGSQLELRIPSGAETGLKLVSGFTVAAGGAASFTIDFDLRKSITDPQGLSEAILRPALRLINNMEVGTVSGTIDPTLVSQACSDAALDDGAVYIYTGTDVTATDVQDAAGDPLVSALVHYSDDAYSYEIGFLPAGDYTLAYTCEAALDNPDSADAIAFVDFANVTVAAGETVTIELGTAESNGDTGTGTGSDELETSSDDAVLP